MGRSNRDGEKRREKKRDGEKRRGKKSGIGRCSGQLGSS